MNEATLKHLEEVVANYRHDDEIRYEDYRCNAINTFPGLVSSLRISRNEADDWHKVADSRSVEILRLRGILEEIAKGPLWYPEPDNTNLHDRLVLLARKALNE